MLAGAAQRDITCFQEGIPMMGWAMPHHQVRRVELPLRARAFVFADPTSGRKLGYVHCELAFITLAIRQEVIAALKEMPELGLGEDNLLLVANHTHSAPGGQSHYLLYNIPIGGYSQAQVDVPVRGMLEALRAADAAKQPVELRRAAGDFPPDVPVAFNRAWAAHSANADTESFSYERRHLAVDRTMRLLRLDRPGGAALGAINWFAVHATNVHSDQDVITPDNKGWAALRMEEGRGEFIAAFAQAAAGDVSPNFRRYPGLPEMRGADPDDLTAMRINGDFQHEKAEELWQEAGASSPLPQRVDGILRYVRMSNRPVDPDFAGGKPNIRTGPAVLGVDFIRGTREGEGEHGFLPWLVERLSRWNGLPSRYAATHAPKVPFVQSEEQRFLGFSPERLPLPPGLHADLARLKRWAKTGAIGSLPFTPVVLPVQLVLLGDLVIAGLPGEPTTQVGRRVRRMLLEELAPLGVHEAVCGGYANAYAGYIVTEEEYELQGYEAASSHFGKWTAAAYLSVLRELARELLKPVAERSGAADHEQPPIASPEVLKKRAWPGT